MPIKPTLLIIDDSAAVRQAVREGLSDEVGVVEADNGVKGIEIIESEPIHVVLLDSNMPTMDGASTLRVLRARGHKMPVILITADTRASRVASMVALGAQAFVAKPIRVDELRLRVCELLSPTVKKKAPAKEPTTIQGPPRAAVFKRISVLLVDPNESAVGRLWEAIPSFVDLRACGDLAAAVAAGKDRRFAAVLVDATVLKGPTASRLPELRQQQREAPVYGVFLRNVADKDGEAKAIGLDAGVHKPFAADEIVRLMEKLAGLLSTLDVHGNVFSVRELPEDEENRERFVKRLLLEVSGAINGAAEASEHSVWLELTPTMPQAACEAMVDAATKQCAALGLSLGVVDAHSTTAAIAARLWAAGVRIVASTDDIG